VSASHGALHVRRRRNQYDSEAQAPPRKRTRIASTHFQQPVADASNAANGVTTNGNGLAHRDVPLRESRSSASTPRIVKSDSAVVLV
jgi:hypothetical protein